jgi:hypothetical protein
MNIRTGDGEQLILSVEDFVQVSRSQWTLVHPRNCEVDAFQRMVLAETLSGSTWR